MYCDLCGGSVCRLIYLTHSWLKYLHTHFATSVERVSHLMTEWTNDAKSDQTLLPRECLFGEG